MIFCYKTEKEFSLFLCFSAHRNGQSNTVEKTNIATLKTILQ